MPVALVDTTVLYAAGGRKHNRLSLSEREIENGTEIVEGILAGNLPKAHIITNIEQETLDHIAEDAGLEDMVATSDEWLANDNIEFVNPSDTVVDAGRDISKQYEGVEFADGVVMAYLNQLDPERKVLYTFEERIDWVFRNYNIEVFYSPRNPFAP
jgi:hypothetical protein